MLVMGTESKEASTGDVLATGEHDESAFRAYLVSKVHIVSQ